MSAIAGIDYSITGPAMCVHPDDKPWSFSNCQLYTIDNVKKRQGRYRDFGAESIAVVPPIKTYNYDIEKFDLMSNLFIEFLKYHNVHTVMFEGYAFAAAGKVFNLAEATGLMKLKIIKNDIKMFANTPPVFKKYATGKGNANKDKMFDSFLEDTGIDLCTHFELDKVRAPVDNLVDAYWICKYMYNEFQSSKS